MPEIEILKKYWGYNSFRPLQQDIVRSVLQGNDTMALLPTGGGKSICFQVPALMMEGICIVVSPLVALMKDQVEHLTAKGIKAVAIYAGMGKREIDIILDNCIYGDFKFLYLSPERLQSELVRTRISYMQVNLIAVDEAHCISQWGYDFRPPYLKLMELRALLPAVPVIALTATATEFVRKDIVDKLEMKDPAIFIQSFARKNLAYVVANEEDKHGKLLKIVKQVKGTGLIYVRNRRETAEVAAFLIRNNIAADFYHAGLGREARFKKQELWKVGQLRVMVATNAFGMGIDKPDVRFVVHLDLPESLEAYYQEAGRAGRDGKKAYAVLLANETDTRALVARYLANIPSVAEIKQIYHALGNYYQLAVGAGEGFTADFDLAVFSKSFKQHPVKVLNALKFLEKDGYLALSEDLFLPSRVIFLVGHEEVYKFQIAHAGFDSFIKTLLRSYGGMFDQFVPVDEAELARRLRTSYKNTVDMLVQLAKQEMIVYHPQTDRPQITFLRVRTGPDHLDIDTKFIALRTDILQQQIAAVTRYAIAETCRSMQLLQYFNEHKSQKCGICDVCIAERKQEQSGTLNDSIDFEIISQLQSHTPTLAELVPALKSGNDHERLNRIRELLDAKKIKTDGTHYYL